MQIKLTQVKAICLSQDENVLFVNCLNGDIRTWDLSDIDPYNPDMENHEQRVNKDADIKNSQMPIAVTLNNKQLLVSLNHIEEAIVIWELKPAITAEDCKDEQEFEKLKKDILDSRPDDEIV